MSSKLIPEGNSSASALLTSEEGRILYELYCNGVGWKNYQGLPCPEFVDLPKNIQEAWTMTALAYEIILQNR